MELKVIRFKDDNKPYAISSKDYDKAIKDEGYVFIAYLLNQDGEFERSKENFTIGAHTLDFVSVVRAEGQAFDLIESIPLEPVNVHYDILEEPLQYATCTTYIVRRSIDGVQEEPRRFSITQMARFIMDAGGISGVITNHYNEELMFEGKYAKETTHKTVDLAEGLKEQIAKVRNLDI